jgi:hypothetical protein
LEDPGRFIEDKVVILPGEVTSPKEVESDLVRGEDGRKVDIYDYQWERWWVWGWKARFVFYRGGYMTRETKCKLSGPLDECCKEQWY